MRPTEPHFIATIPTHTFVLYVSGLKPASRRAVTNLRNFCRRHLRGRFKMHVVDITKSPQKAQSENVVAIPTLIKSWPLPRQVFVGDLSNPDELLSRLALEEP